MARAFRRIIAVGDLHADAEFFGELLSGCDLTDANGRFTARDTALVMLGNICDRGPDSATVYRTLMRLHAEAPAVGSRVYTLLGQHEAIHLFGMHTASSGAERSSYRTANEPGQDALERAFAPGGWLSDWLSGLPVMVRIYPFVFAPADLPPIFRDLQIADVNSAVHQELGRNREAFLEGKADLPLSLFSPETSILCSDAAGQQAQPDYGSVLHTFLKNNRASVYVCGHTPQASGNFLTRYDGRYLCIDTAISFVDQGFGSRSAFEWVDDASYELTFTEAGMRRQTLSLPLNPPA
ncbi:MAG: metallophosphoesterase [Spirochaetaceae bacterium]